MPATLRDLIAPRTFGLRVANVFEQDVLDRPLLWAHSSDLPDPTPWLGTAGLLLTDGAQFSGADQTPARAYVERLVSHGVLALGFATGIVHARIPQEVTAAADAMGLPLLEVPRDTPFMSVIRFVSDAVATDDREVLERSLRAQRSVARAALRPDGLAAILQELEQSLGCWVMLFDAAAAPMRVPTRRSIPEHLSADVRTAVRRMLERGRSSAERLSLSSATRPESEVTLQTLGTQNQLRGVLAVGTGTGTLDRARVDLVDAVIALASIALEQSRTLDDARRRLRSGVLELLLAGMTEAARPTVRHLWGELPTEPLRVACVAAAGGGDDATLTLRSSLDLLAEHGASAVFYAEHDSMIVTITHGDERAGLLDVFARTGARVGFSAPATWETLTSALAEARSALARSNAGSPVTDFDALARNGLLGHLERTHASDIARRVLLPLDSSADPEGLRTMLTVWLDHNGAWDPAAKALGIHRHTLRARIDSASVVLGLDLDTFAARVEVWSALQLTDRTSTR